MKQLLFASVSLSVFALALPANAVVRYETDLIAEAPVVSLGTGTAVLIYDGVSREITLEFEFANLVGTTTASHIHCCTAEPFIGPAGVATVVSTFPFPLGVTSGSFATTFDLDDASSFNPAFITAQGGLAEAAAALLAGLAEGRAYLNIHTSFASGGEIRGFFKAVPEPGMIGLLGIGMLALGAMRRRK